MVYCLRISSHNFVLFLLGLEIKHHSSFYWFQKSYLPHLTFHGHPGPGLWCGIRFFGNPRMSIFSILCEIRSANVWTIMMIRVVIFVKLSFQVYFGASVTKFYLAFHVLGISCFTGMSYLIRKTHLEDVKGISYFGRFLAEDFFLAKYLHNRSVISIWRFIQVLLVGK